MENRKTIKRACILFGAATVLIADVGHAKQITLRADRDASISSGSPNTNYGSQALIAGEFSGEWKSYMHFDIDGTAGLEGAKINSVELRLEESGSPGAYDNMSLFVRAVNAAWDEPNLTWANRPTCSFLGANFYLLPAFTSGGQVVTIADPFNDLRDYVQEIIDGVRQDYGLCLETDTVSNPDDLFHTFRSSERSGDEPRLVIDFTPVPAQLVRVSGRIRFYDGGSGTQGYLPARGIKIEIRAADGQLLTTSTPVETDSLGQYSVDLELEDEEQFKVVIFGSNRGCIVEDSAGDLHSYESELMASGGSTGVEWNFDIDDVDKAGAWNICDVVLQAYDFMVDGGFATADDLNGLSVVWEPGYDVECGACYYRGGKIKIGSLQDGSPVSYEYADCVILHEYGHFVADRFSFATTSPGGSHYLHKQAGYQRGSLDSAQRQALAFSEGWASFFASLVQVDSGENEFCVRTSVVTGSPGVRLSIANPERGQVFQWVFDGGVWELRQIATYAEVTSEDSELAVWGVLWDFVDTDADEAFAEDRIWADQVISNPEMSPEGWATDPMSAPSMFGVLWRVLAATRPESIGGLWKGWIDPSVAEGDYGVRSAQFNGGRRILETRGMLLDDMYDPANDHRSDPATLGVLDSDITVEDLTIYGPEEDWFSFKLIRLGDDRSQIRINYAESDAGLRCEVYEPGGNDPVRVSATHPGVQQIPLTGLEVGDYLLRVYAIDREVAGYDLVLIEPDSILPDAEVEVAFNGMIIEDGDTTPSVEDGTDFGDQEYTDGILVRHFRVSNASPVDLILGTPSSSEPAFTVSDLAETVAPSSFDDFTITFNPDTPGQEIATISFATNDNDENPFTFDVRGVGTARFDDWIAGFPAIPVNRRGRFDDGDGDGVLNVFEHFRGSLPDVSDGRPLLELVTADDGSGVHFSYWKSISAIVPMSRFEWSPDLFHWLGDGETIGNTTVRFEHQEMASRTGAIQYRLVSQTSGDQKRMFIRQSIGSEGGGHDMVRVQGGSFNPDWGDFTIDTFEIGRCEVAWVEWREVCVWASRNGYDMETVAVDCADDHPVRAVNWYDVIKWCNAKSEMDGLTPVYATDDGSVFKAGEADPTQSISANGYRLPSEAEWEFSARGGNDSSGYSYSGSDRIDDVGWYRDNSSGSTCNLEDGRGTWPVGQKSANELGLHDMSGNVWEWCWDAIGPGRRIRGGSWNEVASFNALTYRAAAYSAPQTRYYLFGFRLARSID